MRVRLSYSVELEEVPEHVSQLIDEEWDSIGFCDHTIKEIIDLLNSDDPSIDSSLKKIDKIRQTLGSIDLRFAECESILEGYRQAQSGATEPTEAPVEEQPYSQKYNTPYEVPKESTK